MVSSVGHEMLVMMIPSAALGDRDAVAKLGPLIQQGLPAGQPHLWVSEVAPPLRDRVGQVPDRLVLFAHPTDDFLAFRVDGGDGDNMIMPPWWEPPQCRLLVANVCNGAIVLRTSGWATVFPRWISFDEKLWVFTDAAGTKLWPRVFLSSVSAVRAGGTLNTVFRRVRQAFEDEIADIDTNVPIGDGKDLHLMCFQRALRALTKSEDV